MSRAIREVLSRHTDIIEPLSLDEAYLDVTENKTGLPTATKVAISIRRRIREELCLTASAGVAPNKFLAKIASDWRKPDGLFVIQPKDVDTFLPSLPVGRIRGVGKVTEARLKQIGIHTSWEPTSWLGNCRPRPATTPQLLASMRSFVSAAQKMAEGVSWFIPETRLKLWFSKKFWSWMPRSTLRKLMIEQPTQIANMVQLKEYS